MKNRIIILSWFLAISSIVLAQKTYQMEIKMNDGSVKSYPMQQVIKVIHEGRQTIVYIKSKDTYKIQVLKDIDIASIEWKQSEANTREKDNQSTVPSSQD